MTNRRAIAPKTVEEAIFYGAEALSPVLRHYAKQGKDIPEPCSLEEARERIRARRKLMDLPFPEDTLFQCIVAPDQGMARKNISSPGQRRQTAEQNRQACPGASATLPPARTSSTTKEEEILQTGRNETHVGGATNLLRRLCGGFYTLEALNAYGWPVVSQYQTTAVESAQAFDCFVSEFRAYLDKHKK